MPFIVDESVEIDAAIETVWAVLTTEGEYADWNSFVVDAKVNTAGKTALDIGELITLTVKFRDGTGAVSIERVVSAQPPTPDQDGNVVAEWAYKFESVYSTLGMVSSMRTQTLTQAANGPTVYRSQIRMEGCCVRFAPCAMVKDGLLAMAADLKARSTK